MINLPLYNQGNPQWGDYVMGKWPDGTLLTMRRWGCMVTSLSMALKNYGIDADPGFLCSLLGGTGGLDQEGNLVHSGIEKIYPDVVFYERQYTSNYPGNTPKPKLLIGESLRRLQSYLSLGQPVILEVDNVGNDGRPDHWVVAKEYRDGDFLIHNPDGGIEQWFSKRYGDPAQKLYGFYQVIGQPTGFPPNSPPERQNLGLAAWKAAQVWKGKNVATYSKEILGHIV